MIRLLLADTDTSDQLLQDEEIQALMTLESGSVSNPVNAYVVAGQAARVIAQSFSRQGDQSDGEIRVKYNERAADYRAAAKELLVRGKRGAVPFAGGQSLSQKGAIASNSDRVAPMFERNMLDAPGVPTASSQAPGSESEAPLVPGWPE